MAEDSVAQSAPQQQDTSVDFAARMIGDLLKRGGTEEQPAPAEAAPKTESQPSEPAQAQEAETRSEPEPQADPAPSAPEATVTPEPKQAVRSPELEQQLAQAETRAREAETARNQYLNALNTLVPQLENAIKGEFADIKSFDDLERIANTDPQRYNRFVIAYHRLQQAQQAQQQAQVQASQKVQEAHQAWQASEKAKLGALIPELADPQKGPALARKIEEYALNDGHTAEELSRLNAKGFAKLHKSMLYDNMQADIANAKAKAAKAPPVQTPGNVRTTSTKDEKLSADFGRLQKTGHVNDAAAVFRNLLN